MRIGILLRSKDIKNLATRNVDVLLIIPGSDIDEADIKCLTDLTCVNLNDYLEKGEISKISRSTASFIRSFMCDIEGPNEAIASQNDLYQYHLRAQLLFLTALERYLITLDCYTLVFNVKRYDRYYSPMRPDMGLFYNPTRTLAFLAAQLAIKSNQDVEFNSGMPINVVQSVIDSLMLYARKKVTNLFIYGKLFQKVAVSLGKKYTKNPFFDQGFNDVQEKIGIIVRTDSEVISASYLVRHYESVGQKYVVIQDEILSSTTTVSRLENLNIKYVPIGCLGGFSTLLTSLFSSSKLNYKTGKQRPYGFEQSIAESVLFSDKHVIQELKDRLLDFFVPQLHFATELSLMIKQFNICKLVTFAYVDQWGGIVKAVGDDFRIKTFAIQNAAQDPEEYPRLCWADHYCTESLYLKQCLINLGYPESKISGTGLPHYTPNSTSDKIEVNVSQSNQIVILTQPIYERYYNQLIAAASKFCSDYDYVLAVKYHPRQVGNEYSSAIDLASNICNVKVYKSESLDDIVLSSKMAISVVSAAILRTLNLGVPTVSFLPKSEKYLDLYYTDDNNLFVVSDIPAFIDLLVKFHNDHSVMLRSFESKLEHYVSQHCTFEPTQSPLANVINVIDSK